jgi:GMP synthase-like glutamine amidotransferase
MKKIAFIDPFIESPALHCFNDMIALLNMPLTYYMPSKFGVAALHKEKSKIDFYIIVGSVSHVTEPLPWHLPLSDFLLGELELGKPVFACCFGHQLLCHALGSKVEFATAAQDKFSGVRKMVFNEDILTYKKGESFTLPVSHRQVVTSLGPGLREVASGLSNDIVTHEKLPFLSTQGHPEASHYFCQSDIKTLSADEISLGRRDGAELIKRFFNIPRA